MIYQTKTCLYNDWTSFIDVFDTIHILRFKQICFFKKKQTPGLGQHGHGLYCGVNANSGLQMQEVWKLISNKSTSTDLHHCEWVSSFLFHPPNMFVIPAVMFISHYNVILLCHHIFVISLMLFRGSVVEMVVSVLNLIFK